MRECADADEEILQLRRTARRRKERVTERVHDRRGHDPLAASGVMKVTRFFRSLLIHQKPRQNIALPHRRGARA